MELNKISKESKKLGSWESSSRDLNFSNRLNRIEFNGYESSSISKIQYQNKARSNLFYVKSIQLSEEDESDREEKISLSNGKKIDSINRSLKKNDSIDEKAEFEISSSKKQFRYTDETNPFIVKPIKTRTRKTTFNFEDEDFDDQNNHTIKSNKILNNINLDKNLEMKYFNLLNSDRTKFLVSCCPKETLVQCILKVEKKIYSEYFLYLENHEQEQMISYTKRKIYLTNSAYSFKSSESVKLGELHSNIKRSNYNLICWYESKDEESENDHSYDEEVTIQDSNENNKKHKNYFELNFNNKMIGDVKPKDLVIFMNLFKENTSTLKASKRYKRKILVTKSPEYDTKTNTFILDFHDRAKVPSTNNIQIMNKDDSNKKVVLQIGKLKEKTYTLDFSYPFSVFSAFGLAVSCLTHN